MTGFISRGLKEIFVRPQHNLPALDGLRAFAIIFVVAMHVNGLYLDLGKTSFINQIPPFKGGWMGVPLFFILSGYLIGSQIWKEYLRDGTIQVGRFILRRGFRIWPLYYILCLVFYFSFLGAHIPIEGFLSNLFFLSNYWSDDGAIPGAWSLSTEEQFYILAPALLLLSVNVFKKKPLSFYRRGLYFLFFAPILLRYITWDLILGLSSYEINPYMESIYRPFHTNCEGLIAGLIISNIKLDPSFRQPAFFKYKMTLLGGLLLLMVLSVQSKIYFNFTVIAVTFGWLMWICLEKNHHISQFLSSPIFYPISKTSFCIYLIHIYVIKLVLPENLFLDVPMGKYIGMILSLFFVLVGSFLISCLLYLLVEKPFLNLRNRHFSN